MHSLLNDSRVLSSVQNSVRYSFNQMSNYAFSAKKPIGFISEAYIRNLKGQYSPDKSISPPLSTASPELTQFWNEISLICCENFGFLEFEYLQHDTSAPITFLTDLRIRAEKESPMGHLDSLVRASTEVFGK